MKKLLAMALATVIAAGMVTGCASKSNSSDGSATGSSAPASGEALKLGVLAPLTGEVSVYGVAAKNGIELAIEEINKAGGILGSQIELMIEDEKGDVSEAVNGYNKLMSKGMVALLGDVTSNDYRNRYGTPYHHLRSKRFQNLLYRPFPGQNYGKVRG